MIARSAALGLVAAFVGTCFADEPAKKADPAKKDLARLQGQWRDDEKKTLFFHTLWVSKDRFPHFDEFETSKAIEVKGDKLRYGSKLEREITIVLGTAGGKKTIGFKHGDNSPIVGIYELDEAGFRVCAVDPTLGDGSGGVRLPDACGRTRLGWFVAYEKVKQ